MGRELIVVEPVVEAEALVPAGTPTGTGKARRDDAFADAIAEGIEDGIAGIFFELRADLETGANDDADEVLGEPLELEPADLLLAELNRLWAQPLAA